MRKKIDEEKRRKGNPKQTREEEVDERARRIQNVSSTSWKSLE